MGGLGREQPEDGGGRSAADLRVVKALTVSDDHATFGGLTTELERDEEGQARYVMELLRDYEAGGVEAAFVYTFADRHLPTTGDPEHDFDLAARGIVRVLLLNPQPQPARALKAAPGLAGAP